MPGRILKETKGVTVVVMISWLFLVSHSYGADLLVVVLEEDGGSKSMHYQKTTHQTCSTFLAEFKRNQKQNVPTKLLFEAPPVVNGKVLEAYCILKDGSVVDPDGKKVDLGVRKPAPQ
jgi:hypothetical protein